MDEQLVRWERRTRPASAGEAWAFALIAFGLAACAAFGAGMWWEKDSTLWLTLTAGGVVGLIVLYGRIKAHDERAFQVTEEYAPLAPALAPAEPRIQPWYIKQNGTGGSMTRGEFKFNAQQWRVIAQQLTKAGRLTRRVFEECNKLLPHAKPFVNVTERFEEYKSEMVKLGWVDANTNQITDFGKVSLAEFLTPPGSMHPPTLNGKAPVLNGRGPTTTDDDTDDQWGGR